MKVVRTTGKTEGIYDREGTVLYDAKYNEEEASSGQKI